MHINWNRIPIKLHYTLRYIAVAPLMPLLSMIVSDKGVPKREIGLLWSIMPVIGLFASGISGVLADLANSYRRMLIANLCILLIGNATLYFAPRIPIKEISKYDETRWYNVSEVHYQEVSRVDVVLMNNETNINTPKEQLVMEWDLQDIITFKEFWMSAIAVMLIQIGMLSTMTLEDTICFQIIGDERECFGQQRVFGIFCMGIMTPIAGALVDWYSEGLSYRDYFPTFCMVTSTIILDIVLVATKLDATSKKGGQDTSRLDFKNVLKILFKPSVLLMLIIILASGYAVGIVWTYMLILVREVSLSWDPNFRYQNLLQGLVIGTDTFAGDLPFFFSAGYIIKKLGHKNVFSIVMFVQATRFILYSFVTNPWCFLPIELMHGLHVTLFHATIISYANLIAPEGTEATFQAIFGGLFSFARSLSGYSGGYLLHTFGNAKAFFYLGSAFGIAAALYYTQYIKYIKKIRISTKRKSVDMNC